MTSLSDAFHRARSLLGPTASAASAGASTGANSQNKQRREVFITNAKTAPASRDGPFRSASRPSSPSPKRCRSAFDVDVHSRSSDNHNRSTDNHNRSTDNHSRSMDNDNRRATDTDSRNRTMDTQSQSRSMGTDTHNRSVDTHSRSMGTDNTRTTDNRALDREDDLERRWRESISRWKRRASTGSAGDNNSKRSTTPVRDNRLLTPVGTASSNWTADPQQQQQQQQQHQQAESYPNYVAEVVEQPVNTVPKFRSVGECQTKKQFMSLPGASPSMTPGSGALHRRSYPTIRVRCVPDPSSAETSAIPEAVVVVSCVTAEAPFRAHPNRVYSRDGKSEKGVASASFKRTDGLCELRGLAIERVSNAAEAVVSLREREVARVDPFKQGFDLDSNNEFDLFAVRLCFQVFLKSSTDDALKPLKPIVSSVIRDRSGISGSRAKSVPPSSSANGSMAADRLGAQNLDSSKIMRVFREKNVDANPVSIKREVETDNDESAVSSASSSSAAALRALRRPTVWIGRNFANSDILRNRTRSRSVGPSAQLSCSGSIGGRNNNNNNNNNRSNLSRSKSVGPDEARRPPPSRPRGRPRQASECAAVKRKRGASRKPSPSLMEVSDSAWPFEGGKSVILVCDNADADDIEVRVREKQHSRTGPSPWETTVARDEFHISERGSTVGRIVVTTPKYYKTGTGADATRKVEASLFLVRPSDGRRSEAFTISFTGPDHPVTTATATTQTNLKLLELSEQTFPTSGGKKIIALCDNAQWRDVEVHLEEKDAQSGKVLWSTSMPLEEFRDSDRGSSAACIVFSSPEYRNGHLGQQRGFRKTETRLFLLRPSDGQRTEALPIIFTQRQRRQSQHMEQEPEEEGHPSEQEDRSPPPRSQQQEDNNISNNLNISRMMPDAAPSPSLPVVSQTFSLAGVSAATSEEPLPAPLPLPASSVSSEVRLTAMRNSLSTLTRALGVEREASKFFSQRARDLQRSLDDAVAQRGARDSELASVAAEKERLELERERLLRSLRDAEDARRKEADLRRKEQEARLKEDEARRREESRRKKKEAEDEKRRKRKRRHRSGSESPSTSTSNECCCCRKSNSGIAELSSFLRNEFVTQVSTERAEVTRLASENRRLTTSTQELSASLKEQRRLADNLAWQMEQKQTMIAALEARLKTGGLASGSMGASTSKGKAVSDRESDSEAAEAQVDSDEEILKSKYDRKKKRRLYHQKRC